MHSIQNKISLEMDQQEALLDDGSPSPRPPTPILPVEDGGAGEGDSSSADSALPADAVSAQLINNITMLDYHSLGKTTTLIDDPEELGNVGGMEIAQSAQLPHFVSWNWPIIRKVLFWGVLSALFACAAAVVAMIAALPKTCNPALPWYHGRLFYEIFPASYHDANGDGVGDFQGIVRRADYIGDLGVRAIRLNSIFRAPHYPEHYRNASSLVEIDRSLGTIGDFAELLRTFHSRNISVLLDLPIHPLVRSLEPVRINQTTFESPVTAALKFWSDQDVDGFYIKGLEHYADDVHFSASLAEWKRVVGPNRILMVSHEMVLSAKEQQLNDILQNVDLVDVFLDVSNGSDHIKRQVDAVTNSILWSKPEYPWVHWQVGNVDTKRLSSKVSQNTTLSAILFSMLLPGTPSIFYGDEVGLREVSEAEEDFHELKYIHNLTPMIMANEELKFTTGKHLPWITGVDSKQVYVPFHNVEIIRLLAKMRTESTAMYLNAVLKDDVILPNTEIRYSGEIIILNRWYPRKSSFVFVSNFGKSNTSSDLSSLFYGGTVMVSSNLDLKGKEVKFKSLSLTPAESMVIKLEK